ncbi:MAG TPA: VacJ family lipoprotein [Pedomonas sp.]|uniref:MlaA family lipoprotein n=1 Tax=Pedomonas sp. TaxID=2976421 RepID=UPI002F3FF45C
MTHHRHKLLIGAAAMLAMTVSLAGPVHAADEDPFEKTNRSIYKFNDTVDRAVLKPVAKGYRAIAPKPIRKGVSNFLSNLREPFTFVNALLQFKPDVAANALGRFLINTTIGVGGLWDQATKLEVYEQREDFGQTLATWGVPSGPYLVIPFLGPSNPRDFLGDVVLFVTDPVDIVVTKEVGNEASYGLLGARVIDLRANAIDTIDPLLNTADDPYVFMRSAYQQNRAFAISDGKISTPSEEDDIFGDEQPMPSDVLTPQSTVPAAPATPEQAPAPEGAETPPAVQAPANDPAAAPEAAAPQAPASEPSTADPAMVSEAADPDTDTAQELPAAA